MKKVLIGCGVVAILLFCLVVGVVWYASVKVNQYAKTLEKIQADYKQTNQRFPFAPPDPPLLRRDRLDVFLQVREQATSALQGEAGVFQKLQQAQQQGTQPSISFRDVTGLIALPKKIGQIHVNALESHSMSLDEYQWHSKMVTGTLLKTFSRDSKFNDQFKETYQKFARDLGLPAAGGGQGPDFTPLLTPLGVAEVPLLEENARLLEEYQDRLEERPESLWFDFFLRQINQSQAWGAAPRFPAAPAAPPEP